MAHLAPPVPTPMSGGGHCRDTARADSTTHARPLSHMYTLHTRALRNVLHRAAANCRVLSLGHLTTGPGQL